MTLFFSMPEISGKGKIGMGGLSNYITLMCGFLAFSVIMLLNPSGLDYLPWDDMVDESPTLTWLRRVLQPLGFTLKEIIIIDVFSLLTNQRMDNLPDDEKLRMASEVFNLTVKFLHHFQPQIVISCQCSTKPYIWLGWCVISRCEVVNRRGKSVAVKVRNISVNEAS